MSILECVPNISEGRDRHTVMAIVAAVAATGLDVLDLHVDADHHRSVLTFAGDPDRVVAGALAAAGAAVAAIDVRQHAGVHPRIGAIDVVPFVPVADLTLADAAASARSFAATFAERHAVPVFLYEAAATVPTRARLEVLRRGGLPRLGARMASDPAWAPDYGPPGPHPTAGVTAVGARRPLIAWNVELATDRLDVARTIATAVRESSGGLPAVKALGLPLGARRIVQVSLNLTDFEVTPMRVVYDRIAGLAEAMRVEVLGSELVGLAPAAALDEQIALHIKLRDFSASRILERRLGGAGR